MNFVYSILLLLGITSLVCGQLYTGSLDEIWNENVTSTVGNNTIVTAVSCFLYYHDYVYEIKSISRETSKILHTKMNNK